MRQLIALYPGPWRRRYGLEFEAMLAAQPPSPGLIVDIVLGAIDAHLDPQVAEDGEDRLRRRIKEVVMDGLRSRRVQMAIGLALPFVFLGLSYLNYEIRHGGLVLPMAIALATGLLVGRWWAPLPFVGTAVVATLAMFRGFGTVEATGWFAQLVIAWAMVCLIGVGVRLVLARDLAQLRDPRPTH